MPFITCEWLEDSISPFKVPAKAPELAGDFTQSAEQADRAGSAGTVA